MQILIEIPKSEIPKQQDVIEIPLHFIDGNVCEAGGYGFYVLPKGHGNLVDYEELKNNAREYGAYAEATISHIKPQIIIEADKAESEE